MKPKVLVIVGPTASGKSALAVNFAKKLNGEVISADSRQVYKGMDVGSGKLEAREMRGVKHHLLDVADPKKNFTVAQYQKLANQAIEDILGRGKTPIICGGTGFYVQAVVDGLTFPPVPPNPKLRAKLEKLSTTALVERLDPARAKNIDLNNRRRLIRAVEIATALGNVPKLKKQKSPYQFIQIGIDSDNEKLRKNIQGRLLARLKNGMIAEVKKLHQGGVSWKRLESFGLEYKYVALYLQGKLTKKEMVSQLETAIWQYSRRQMTWFRRDKRIKWLAGPPRLERGTTVLETVVLPLKL